MEHLPSPIPCPISEKAQSAPDHQALITDSTTWTYADLDRAICSLAQFLQHEGIRERQRVAFIAHNEPSTVLLLFALFRLGAIACPLSHRLPQEALSRHLEQLKPDHFLDSTSLPLASCSEPASQATIDPNSLATFLFTSGSSGRPKIACHTFANHYYNALGSLEPLRLTSSSRWLLSLPLFHVSGIGILFRCFQQGATVVMSRKTVSEALTAFQISHLSLVPTQLYRMLQEPNLPSMGALRCILLGGAPIPVDLLRRAKEKQLPVFTTYGLTETSSMVLLSGKNPDVPAGKPLPFREIRIDGEIQVSGRTLFQGYWDVERERIVPADRNGWFSTGDIGRWLPSGELEVVGRKDRMFISGGENIHPEEIELALQKVPGIRQAYVLPVADPEFGERPIACIDDATGSHTVESLRAALASELPSFKHPVRIFPWPAEAGLKPDPALLKAHLKSLSDHRG